MIGFVTLIAKLVRLEAKYLFCCQICGIYTWQMTYLFQGWLLVEWFWPFEHFNLVDLALCKYSNTVIITTYHHFGKECWHIRWSQSHNRRQRIPTDSHTGIHQWDPHTLHYSYMDYSRTLGCPSDTGFPGNPQHTDSCNRWLGQYTCQSAGKGCWHTRRCSHRRTFPCIRTGIRTWSCLTRSGKQRHSGTDCLRIRRYHLRKFVLQTLGGTDSGNYQIDPNTQPRSGMGRWHIHWCYSVKKNIFDNVVQFYCKGKSFTTF